MAVKIRLQRKGKKKSPTYSIVVTDTRNPRDGKFIEHLGNYNPIINSTSYKKIWILEDRILYWMSHGAKMSKVVSRLLNYNSILPRNPIKKGN